MLAKADSPSEHHAAAAASAALPRCTAGGKAGRGHHGTFDFTDDGALLHRLTHPKRHVPKRYRVTCKHAPSYKMLEGLVVGVKLKDEKETLAADDIVRVDEYTIDMTITSGKYHQVKRMVAAAGNRVEALQRIAFGALRLPEDLACGKWRWLSGPDVFTTRNDTREEL